MYTKFGSIGIQPIHIRFVSNASPQNVLTLTKNMLYAPGDNNGNNSEYPFFTDMIEYSEQDLSGLSRIELINTFFNINLFRKNIIYHKQTTNDENKRAKNADHNLKLMIQFLLRTSFPITNNVSDTYNRTIAKKQSEPITGDNSFLSYLSDLFKYETNKFCYLNLNGTYYTLLSVIHVNDLINDKKFKEFITLLTSYKEWHTQIIAEYEKEKTGLEKTINELEKNHKLIIAKYIIDQKNLITKTLITEADKRRNIKVSTQPLVDLLFKIKSDTPFSEFIKIMAQISELKKYAERKGSGVGYIPSYILDLKGFNELLTISFDFEVNKQILEILKNPKIIFEIFTKDIKINESNLIKIIVHENIKKMRELSSFINYMKSFSKPNNIFSNIELNNLISTYETDYTQLFKVIDLINKLNTYEKPDKKLLEDPEIKNLRTGVISHSESNIQDDKNKNKDIEVFNLKSKKYYDVFLNLELIKGLLNKNNLEEIKCSYRNNNLINRYDTLKNKLENINPILLYIPNNLLDIEMLKKNTKQTKTKQTPIKRRKTEKKISGGWKTNSKRKNTDSMGKSPKSLSKSLSIDTGKNDKKL